MNTSISKSMWTSNPGYVVRDGTRMASHFKKEFTYDQEEVRGRLLEIQLQGVCLQPASVR
jgi:hypothetical protein